MTYSEFTTSDSTEGDKFCSIIVPTLNEEKYVGKILTDINNSQYNQNRLEIIVADSGSKDRTSKIVEEFQEHHKKLDVKFVCAQKKGPSLARNTGAKHAEGQHFIFLDADTRIDPDFIRNATHEMVARELSIAGCYAKPDSGKNLDRLSVGLINLFGGIVQYTEHPLAVGAGIVVRKDFHEKLGGFDEGIHFGEDLDYARRASKLTTYRMLDTARIIFSMRRFNDEGRYKVFRKALIGQYYYYFDDLRNIQFDYVFGKHK